jgi:hypothetical protein
MARKPKAPKTVETFKHEEASRMNIPTAAYQSVMQEEQQHPVRVAYERRNRDLDPQLVWRGKDEQDWSDLVVQAPPLYIQEKVHPKVLMDDLMRRTEPSKAQTRGDIRQGFVVGPGGPGRRRQHGGPILDACLHQGQSARGRDTTGNSSVRSGGSS